MTEHIDSIRTYTLVLLALLALTAVTTLVAFVDLGAFSVVVALAIAVCKMLLVALFFMHVRHSTKLTKLVVLGGLLWLAILLMLTLSDFTTRDGRSLLHVTGVRIGAAGDCGTRTLACSVPTPGDGWFPASKTCPHECGHGRLRACATTDQMDTRWKLTDRKAVGLELEAFRRFTFSFVKKEIELARQGVGIHLLVPPRLFAHAKPLDNVPIFFRRQAIDSGLDLLNSAHAWSLSPSRGAIVHAHADADRFHHAGMDRRAGTVGRWGRA